MINFDSKNKLLCFTNHWNWPYCYFFAVLLILDKQYNVLYKVLIDKLTFKKDFFLINILKTKKLACYKTKS